MRSLLLTILIALAGCTITVDETLSGPPRPTPAESRHLALGNPSGAAADPGQPENYLIVRDQYALSYSRSRGIPNWVSWQLEADDLGPTERFPGPFISDESLPLGWYRVAHGDYSGSGYDRGHLVPSADRTASPEDNQATFILTNVLPQAPENNQGLWNDLEAITRDLVRQGNQLHIVAGGAGEAGRLAGGRLTVPAVVWKAILVLPGGPGQIGPDAQVIAVWTPNDASVAGRSWEEYTVSLACLEERSGLDLFAALPDDVEAALAGPGCGQSAPAPLPAAPASTADPAICAAPADPLDAPEDPVAIIAVDKRAELVTLENLSAEPVDLAGWTLCSLRGGQAHPVGGSLAPGEQRAFPGPAETIWSNGDRDDGALYDAEGRLVSYWIDQ